MTITDHLDYGAFGTIVLETNSAAAGRAYLYTALAEDRDTGIVQAHRRMLLVTTGQWMQEDPIAFSAGDSNLRRYVGNDPSNQADPTGLQARAVFTAYPQENGSVLANLVWLYSIDSDDANSWIPIIVGKFPNLQGKKYGTDWAIIGKGTTVYDCHGFVMSRITANGLVLPAAGFTVDGTPTGRSKNPTFQNFKDILEADSWHQQPPTPPYFSFGGCIALFAKPGSPNIVSHSAIQINEAQRWTCKLGQLPLVWVRDLHYLEGTEYGTVQQKWWKYEW
jgi:RHS repeat-associated protein